MREIKFRAWDKRLKKMYYQGGEWFIEHDATQKYLAFPIQIFENPDGYPQDIEIQQYTGLKDVNGKEVYEGDVVKHEGGRVREVYWRGACVETGSSDYVSDGECGWPEPEEIEIIGNIYENPELIKQ